MKEFLESYYSCIERMDLTSVKPFTETEIQPLYSKQWLECINKLCDAINEDMKQEDLASLFLNKSLIRSMLVMDLFDCAFVKDKELAHKIFKTYSTIIEDIYSEDPYSTYKNTHRDKINFEGTYDKNPLNKKILHWCYNFSYTQWQDIYADNTYEITGPFHTRDYTYIVQDFRLIPNIGDIKIISRYDKINIYDIKIDMFGHCDYKLHDPIDAVEENIIITKDDITHSINDKSKFAKVIEDEYELMKEKIFPSELMKRIANFSSRYKRYEKLFNKFDIEYNPEEISKALSKRNKLHPRLNVEQTKELLNTLL